MNDNELLLQQVKDLLNGKKQEQSIKVSELPELIENFEKKSLMMKNQKERLHIINVLSILFV